MKLYLVPAPGLTVIKPESNTPLAAEGESVEDSTYWRRRMAEGDVAEGKAPKSKSKE